MQFSSLTSHFLLSTLWFSQIRWVVERNTSFLQTKYCASYESLALKNFVCQSLYAGCVRCFSKTYRKLHTAYNDTHIHFCRKGLLKLGKHLIFRRFALWQFGSSNIALTWKVGFHNWGKLIFVMERDVKDMAMGCNVVVLAEVRQIHECSSSSHLHFFAANKMSS